MILRTLAIAALAIATPAIAAASSAQPELKITTIDGKPFDLAAQRGKWVVVNYWATWCVPCIKEMPDISNFVKTHKNVTAIGLAFEDTDVKRDQDVPEQARGCLSDRAGGCHRRRRRTSRRPRACRPPI